MNEDIMKFPLAWRWTQTSHNVLPDSILAQMIPLDAEASIGLDKKHMALFSGRELDVDLFNSIKKHEGEDMTLSFLSTLDIEKPTSVFLSWNSNTALRTTWDIFCQYWDDFCYPSSDDVTVTPEDDSWILCYHHEDAFEFGRRKK
jgi:hypothetical protein